MRFICRSLFIYLGFLMVLALLTKLIPPSITVYDEQWPQAIIMFGSILTGAVGIMARLLRIRYDKLKFNVFYTSCGIVPLLVYLMDKAHRLNWSSAVVALILAVSLAVVISFVDGLGVNGFCWMIVAMAIESLAIYRAFYAPYQNDPVVVMAIAFAAAIVPYLFVRSQYSEDKNLQTQTVSKKEVSQ